MPDTTTIGTDFENEVANLYRMLGYEIESNLDLEGFQIDLIASRQIPGADKTKLLIECKYKNTGSISNEEVAKLSYTFTETARENGFNKAILVTNSTFSQKASAFAMNKPHLVLKTVKELEDELLDVYTAYGHYKRSYQHSFVHSLYVPLGGYGYLPGEEHSEKTFENVEESIIEWIDNRDTSGFLTIMADFGAGKTTLLERLKYFFCDHYVRKSSNVKPIIFKAKELHKFNNIDEYVLHTISEEFGKKIDINVIWQQIKEGRFLILIDGFDEVAQRVDEKQRRKFFAELSALFNTQCHSIMTCRPTFFIDQQEYDNLIFEVSKDQQQHFSRTTEKQEQLYADHSTKVYKLAEGMSKSFSNKNNAQLIRGLKIGRMYLSQFSEDQVEIYLKNLNEEFLNSCSLTWKDVLDFLYAVYDIRDLMRRPILLDMITRTVLSGEIDVRDHDQRLSATDIYEAYIRALLVREYQERETRQLLESHTRQSLLEVVAVTMYQIDSMEVSFDDVLKAIAEKKETLSKSHLDLINKNNEHIAADIVLTGFLMRDSKGALRFTHKSFLEHLVARFIVKHLAEKIIDEIANEWLPKDIIYFIGSFLIHDRKLFDSIVRQIRNCEFKKYKNFKNNLARAIVSSSPYKEDFSLNNIEINDISAKEIHWKSAEIENVTFEIDKLEKQKYETSTLTNVTFLSSRGQFFAEDNTEIDCTFENYKLDKIAINESHGTLRSGSGIAKTMLIENSNLELNGDWVINELVAKNSEIRNKKGKLVIKDLKVTNCLDCYLKSINCNLLNINNSILTFGDIPTPIDEPQLKGNNTEPTSVFTIENSTLFIPAYFSSNLLITAKDLLKTWKIKHCNLVGFTVDITAMNTSLWPQCQGVLFFTNPNFQADNNKENKENKETSKIIDNFLFVDNQKFRENHELANDIMNKAEEMFGTWIKPWIKNTRKAIQIRKDG